MSDSSGVQVVVRIRPLNEREKKHGTLPVISASTGEKTVTVLRGTGGRQARSQYKFDGVYTAFSTQSEVFEGTLKPVIRDVMMGYEGTVFAYGQTGTGKTHTMEGDLDHPENFGVIPRAAMAIFEELNREEMGYEDYKVSCSYLEIYNEELCDLLIDSSSNSTPGTPKSPKRPQKLEILEGKNGPFCRGLSQKEVRSAEDLLEIMQSSQANRNVAATAMNKQSSRSHCLFTLRVEAKRRLEDGALFETRGKLHMVDLAGSECAKSANLENDSGGQQAARERERRNINTSLLTLGRVVALLKEQSTKSKPGNVRIPYRDSKLTRILQQALGGNSKTVIVATLSPSVTAIEESVSTLNYAQAAHGIINKPVSASYLSEATKSSAILSGMQCPTSGPQSLEQWKEMEIRLEYMKCQVEEAKAALARKHLQQQEIIDRAEKAEAEYAVLEDQLTLVQKKADQLKDQLTLSEEKRMATEKDLKHTRDLLDRTTLVLNATQQTEVKLTDEALALLEALKRSVANGDQLYEVILANKEADLKRQEAAKHFNSSVAVLLTDVKQALNALSEEGSAFQCKSTELVTTNASKEKQFLEDAKEVLRNAVTSVETAVNTLKSNINDGIAPTVDIIAKDTDAGVGNIWTVLESSEKVLMSNFDSTRAQLAEMGNRLTELELSHTKAADETIAKLGNGIAASKESVGRLVSSTCSALEQARANREKIRDVTRETIEQWKRAMIESGDLVHKQSSEHKTKVEETEAMITAEMKRHENIESGLVQQGQLLESSQSVSEASHQAQKELLVQTKETMESTNTKQKELLSCFVQRLMKDVESLVQNQVSEVLQVVTDGHSSFLENTSSLMSNHEDITSSTIATLVKARELRSNVQQEAMVAKQNDEVLISRLRDTKSVLGGIETAVRDNQEQASKFAADTLQNIKESEDIESADSKAREDLAAGGEDLNNFLANSVHDEVVSRLSLQREAGNGLVSFTRSDVLQPMTAAVAEMEKPRSEMMSALAKECSGLEESVESGLIQIKEKASASAQVASTLQDAVQSIESSFVETTAEPHSAGIVERETTLLEHGAEHADFTTRRIGRAGDGSAKMASTVESFVKIDLSAFTEVEEAPAKEVITFSEQLSSTPGEKEILAMATKLERTGASAVLQALSPNHDRSLGNKKIRGQALHTIPNFQHERNEPRMEHLS